jgi:hypothetical protein
MQKVISGKKGRRGIKIESYQIRLMSLSAGVAFVFVGQSAYNVVGGSLL